MAQVANKDIANSSGAGVRADLNLALAAEASNNFGDKAQVVKFYHVNLLQIILLRLRNY